MRNLFLILLVPVLFGLNGGISSNEIIKKEKRTFADLTKAEKIEAFKHFMTTGDCEYKGIRLSGKVQFVDNFPDIKIQEVTSFPDIKVKLVKNFPDDCGEWQIVDNFPDFKVQKVTSFPDLKVQFVKNFPGMN